MSDFKALHVKQYPVTSDRLLASYCSEMIRKKSILFKHNAFEPQLQLVSVTATPCESEAIGIDRVPRVSFEAFTSSEMYSIDSWH